MYVELDLLRPDVLNPKSDVQSGGAIAVKPDGWDKLSPLHCQAALYYKFMQTYAAIVGSSATSATPTTPATQATQATPTTPVAPAKTGAYIMEVILAGLADAGVIVELPVMPSMLSGLTGLSDLTNFGSVVVQIGPKKEAIPRSMTSEIMKDFYKNRFNASASLPTQFSQAGRVQVPKEDKAISAILVKGEGCTSEDDTEDLKTYCEAKQTINQTMSNFASALSSYQSRPRESNAYINGTIIPEIDRYMTSLTKTNLETYMNVIGMSYGGATVSVIAKLLKDKPYIRRMRFFTFGTTYAYRNAAIDIVHVVDVRDDHANKSNGLDQVGQDAQVIRIGSIRPTDPTTTFSRLRRFTSKLGRAISLDTKASREAYKPMLATALANTYFLGPANANQGLTPPTI